MKSSHKYQRNLIISIACFIIILTCFIFGISSVSAHSDAEAKRTLEMAVSHAIVQCYVIEGSYPQDLEYLTTHYGITYDEERFFIDYNVLGRNIMPEVTIIDRGRE